MKIFAPFPRFLLLALFAGSLGLCMQPILAAERIVVDLSRYDVPVSAGFSGARLLLFGASPQQSSREEGEAGGARDQQNDIFIKVRGPSQSYTIARKERFFGLWRDGERWHVSSVPAFFQILTSENEDNWFDSLERRRTAFSFRDLSLSFSRQEPHKIRGLADVDFEQEPEARKREEHEDQDFRDAFLRRQSRLGLYGVSPNSIERLGNNLFRVTLTLPSGLPTGTYIVETFLVENGKLTSAQATPLFVRRAGASAFIFAFAERYSFLYGFCAVLVALLAGVVANRLFSRP